MSRTIFHVMGGFTLCLAASLFVLGIYTMVRYPPRSLWDVGPFIAVMVTLIGTGIGLFRLRKWAALVISLMALYVATLQIRDALHPIPGYANWLGLLFAVLLAIPSILTAVYWGTLVWRDKRTRAGGQC